MGLAARLIREVVNEATEYRWDKATNGYELADGLAKLQREKKCGS